MKKFGTPCLPEYEYVPDGVHEIRLVYEGKGKMDLLAWRLLQEKK